MTATERLLATFADEGATLRAMQTALAQAWGADGGRPMLQLPSERWTELFRRAGHFSLGLVPPPRETLRLYRGAADGWERGMSWTPSPDIARRFDFALWTCVVTPADVLASFPMMCVDVLGNPAIEYVVDTSSLAIQETFAPGHGGRVLRFRGRTVAKVERNVQRFLADNNLDGLRKSALGWTVLRPRRHDTLAAVEFTGYPAPLAEAARRHDTWHH